MDAEKIGGLKQIDAGSVGLPGDALYEKAREMFTRTIAPGAVVCPRSNEDVAKIINFVRDYGIPFAIRSGGHSNIATRLADGILLIDMSGLASVEVIDESKGVVRVGAGALWHEVASKLEKYSLGLSSGDTRTVGVGGLATGAGLGWMIRKYGPLVDNIVSAEVVTADGSVMKADESENADLFWAIRGGGSNFGIVTHFTFRAHKVEGIFDGTIIYPLRDVGRVLTGWRDAMRSAPAELSSMLMVLPGMGENPASIIIRGCFEGTDENAATEAFSPFLNLGTPVRQEIVAKPYGAILEDATAPQNVRVIVHNAFLKELTDEAIKVIEKFCQEMPSILQIRHVAGMMNERPAEMTAFSHRDSEVLIVSPTFITPEASEEAVGAALDHWRTLERFSQGAYLNLLSEDTGKEVSEAFPPATLDRLRMIKSRYDPDNIFRTNYNILPETT